MTSRMILRDVCPQPDVASHVRAAQIEVAMLEADLFVDRCRVVLFDGERQSRSRTEDLDLRGHDLDLAGGQVGVGVAFRATRDLPDDPQAEL